MKKEIKNKISLTGDRPTGQLHLGHFVGSIQNRVKMQDEYNQFVMVADIQALTDNANNPEKVRSNVLEVAIDNLSVGVDPKKTTFFIQSQIPEIAELTIFFLNLVTLSRLERNPTVKNEMKQKKYESNVPAGFLCYPVSQSADILAFGASLVPVGEDQLPMIEQANELVHKFNSTYGEVFEKITPIVSSAPRLMGIDGKAKMSKSLGNTILLSDTPDIVRNKVMKMFTDPKHIHKNDPGRVEGNVVFDYLSIFDNQKDELENIKSAYKRGGVGDVEIKERLIKILNEILQPIREKRKEYEKNKDEVMNILVEGGKKARIIAQIKMLEIKKAMRLDY